MDGVPGHVILMRAPSAAFKAFFEDDACADLSDIEQSPSGLAPPRPISRAAKLVYEQSRDSVLNAVVVWLYNAHAAVITQFDETLVTNGEPEFFIEGSRCDFHVAKVWR